MNAQTQPNYKIELSEFIATFETLLIKHPPIDKDAEAECDVLLKLKSKPSNGMVSLGEALAMVAL